MRSGKHCYHGFLDWASTTSGLACGIMKAMSNVKVRIIYLPGSLVD